MRGLPALFVLVLSVALSSTAHAAPVTFRSLLAEMADLDRLTQRPNPAYTCAQASSYDRASKSPDVEWFANGDAGKFLRIEDAPGRKEHVLADLKGPGAVVRIWSANPAGVIRFYFDGEREARLVAPMADLLGGKVSPMGDPFAYFSARGANLYFPLPYRTSLKVTVDDTLGGGVRHLYYHVGYRSYEAGAVVESFDPAKLQALLPEIQAVGKVLLDPDSRQTRRIVRADVERAADVAAGKRHPLLEMTGSGAVYELRVRLTVPSARGLDDLPWADPRQVHNALRAVRLVGEFDGEACVDVPIGDFFGTVAGLSAYKTLPMEVRQDGWMVCRYFMPFGRSANLFVRNDGSANVRIEHHARVIAYRFGASSYHFRAQWTGEKTFSRPMKDARFLTAQGEGIWLGSSLHVANPTGAWWGEGDEKVFVDGEAFPSTFGTGTEDYYGYAWCDPTPFARPYHAQPRCDGPGNRGHTLVNRWHVFDPIPYRKSLQFDIELWHWAEVNVDYDRTAYWYARPGGTKPATVDPKLLPITEIAKPKPVLGAIEGEDLEVVSRSGGALEKQGGFWELSSEHQLWWQDMKPGETLVLRVPVAESGRYEVLARVCMNRDYGIHELSLLGASRRFDFFSNGLKWETVSLGTFELQKGTFTLTVKNDGHREGAIPKNMFGLDYLMLKKAG